MKDKEYIEREKARELIDNYGKNAIDSGRWSLDPVDDIIALAKGVDKISSADVVEVVRCKSCQFWNTYIPYPDGLGCCQTHASKITGENDFCSYGIRKED